MNNAAGQKARCISFGFPLIPFRQIKRKMAETLDLTRNFSHLPISLL